MKEIKNSLIEDINAFAVLASGNQQKYYQDLLKVVEPVKMVSIKKVFSPDEIAKIKRLVRPKKKMCYRNAHLLTCLFPDKVKYVDGRVAVWNTGFPIDHAFNKVGDKYIDITSEMVWGEDVSKYDYIKFGEYDVNQLDYVTEKTGYYGECYKFYWMQENKLKNILYI